MDDSFSGNGHLLNLNSILADPRVQGLKILNWVPDNDWDGPTICVRNGEGWDLLSVEPILGRLGHRDDN